MKVLHASNFVPCGSIVLGEFSLNDDLRVELVWNYEVWCLIEPLNAFSPFCFVEAHTVQVQNFLNSCFENIPDEFTDRIAVTGEGPAEKAFIEHHGILGIEKHSLPAKLYLGQKSPSITSRYFVDKFPMFLPARGTPAVVTFTYVESEAENLAGFMTHLQNYLPLFRKLKQFAFLFISPYGELFPKARGIFTSLVKNPLELPTATELLRYFRIRRAWEAKQFAQLTNDDIEFLNEATHRFHAQRFQDLYQSWNRGNLEESTLGSMFAGSNGARQVRFDTYLVKPQAFLSRSLGGRG